MKTIITAIVFILISSVCYGQDSTDDAVKYRIKGSIEITQRSEDNGIDVIGKIDFKVTSDIKSLITGIIQAMKDFDKLLYRRQ